MNNGQQWTSNYIIAPTVVASSIHIHTYIHTYIPVLLASTADNSVYVYAERAASFSLDRLA